MLKQHKVNFIFIDFQLFHQLFELAIINIYFQLVHPFNKQIDFHPLSLEVVPILSQWVNILCLKDLMDLVNEHFLVFELS